MLLISIIYNSISLIIYKNMVSIAIATTLAFITWYFYSMRHFKYLKCDKKELIYLLGIFCGFILASNLFSWYVGGILYLILYFSLVFLLYKVEVKIFIQYFKNLLYSIKKLNIRK